MQTKTVALEKTFLFSHELILPALAFTIPFLISAPQLLTGTLVNCFLYLTATYSSKKTVFIVSLLPSLAALLNGVVFGKSTPYLLYFLPFIWTGNLILISAFQTLKQKTTTKIVVSALLKSLFLYAFAFVYLKLLLVPQIFLTAMGIFQFITAISGGILFLLVNLTIPPRRWVGGFAQGSKND